MNQHTGSAILKGVAASTGVTIGKAFLLDQVDVAMRRIRVPEAQLEGELSRLDLAIASTRQEIDAIKLKVTQEVGRKEAAIFNAYLHVLNDPLLVQAARERIRQNRTTADYALNQVAKGLIREFSESKDEYLRERAADIQDVVARLMRNLTGQPTHRLPGMKEEVVVVAKDLTPSQTASMRRERVIGFATDVGGRTSHAAIMARSLEIPAVVGLMEVTSRVKTGDTLVIDGTQGMVLVNPAPEVLAKYRQAQQRMLLAARKLKKLKGMTAVTTDGYRLTVAANLELPEEIRQARKYGAEGVGLFRTEFLYLNRADLPSEEEQFEAYRVVAEQSLPYSAIMRTLDLGGDKLFSRLGTPTEANPFLGLRGIRLCLNDHGLFRTQLRAILRASHYGKMKIMFPMISGVEELRRALAVLLEVKHELARRRIPFDRNLEVGVMIELPSAAMTADVLAREVNFFSIGTNDLIQYTMAADRVNESVAYLYNPLHPAILRTLKRVIEAGHDERIWVGMCGEMASDPQLTALLVGLGLDEFSTSPAFIPQLKRNIRETTFAAAKELAETVLACATIREVEDVIAKEGATP